MSLPLTPAMEDYLEAILQLVREQGVARSRDIAKRLGVHKSTVTAALKSLGEAGLIHYAPYELITLTDAGETLAEDVLRRHEALREFFIEVLRVAPDVAETAACGMEHAAPREVIERMVDFGRFVRNLPPEMVRWTPSGTEEAE